MSVNRFSIVPTTADLAIEAFGGTLKELFAQLGLGLFSIMCDLETVRPRETLEVAVEAPSREALLVNWVNELIYLHEVNQFFACKVRVGQMTDKEIKAKLLGEKVDPERHALLTEVKAATYHELTLEQVASQGWRVYVLVDI